MHYYSCTLFICSLGFQVAALILENTFTSILDMAGVLLPFLKWFIGGTGSKCPKILNFLVRSRWSTIDIISQVKLLSHAVLSSLDHLHFLGVVSVKTAVMWICPCCCCSISCLVIAYLKMTYASTVSCWYVC